MKTVDVSQKDDPHLSILAQDNIEGHPRHDVSKILANFNKLATVPDILTKFNSLTALILSHNRIWKLGSLDQLPNLTHLDLSYNKLSGLFRATGTHLETLLVGHNSITELDVSQLKELACLEFQHNRIRQFPSGVCQLNKLFWLNGAENQIESLPEMIRHLANLTYLQFGANRLHHLPVGLAYLPGCRIYLSDNPIEYFPPILKYCHRFRIGVADSHPDRKVDILNMVLQATRYCPGKLRSISELETTIKTDAFLSTNTQEHLLELIHRDEISDWYYISFADLLSVCWEIIEGHERIKENINLRFGQADVLDLSVNRHIELLMNSQKSIQVTCL